MSNTINYEWKLETIDPRDSVDSMDSDIVDFEHVAPGELSAIYPPNAHQRICLVREVVHKRDILERDHAYIMNGVLQHETMEDRHTVPQRFHAELAKVSA